MTLRRRFFTFLTIVLVILATSCYALLPDFEKCADENCSVLISHGRTSLRYNSKDSDVLSFPANIEVKVFSKGAGTRPDLWGVEILGKRGYIPKQFMRESRIFHGDLKYLVPTKGIQNGEVNYQPQKTEESADNNQQDDKKAGIPENETIKPHKVSPYEVDGTLLPYDDHDLIPPQPDYLTRSVQQESLQTNPENVNTKPEIVKSQSENVQAQPGIVTSEKEIVKSEPETEKSKSEIVNEPELEKTISESSQVENDGSETEKKNLETGEDSEKKDDVKLGVYPNIITSTFSAVSGFLNYGEEESEEDSAELSSLEETEGETVTEKTPEITKTDESSLNSEEKQDSSIEGVIPTVKIDESKVSESDQSKNILVDQPVLVEEKITEQEKVSETQESLVTDPVDNIASPVESVKTNDSPAIVEQSDSTVNIPPESPAEQPVNHSTEKPIDSSVNTGELVNAVHSSVKVSEPVSTHDPSANVEELVKKVDSLVNVEEPVNTVDSSENVSKPVSTHDPSGNVEELVKTVDSPINVEELVNTVDSSGNVGGPVSKVDSAKIEELVKTIDSTKINQKTPIFEPPSSSNLNVGEGFKESSPKSEDSQEYTVPKQNENVAVPDVSIPKDDLARTVNAAEEKIVDTAYVEKSITPEVPLKQHQEAASPAESFTQYENSYHPQNDTIEIKNEVVENYTAPEALSSVDTPSSPKVEDNIVDSNNNVVDNHSYTTAGIPSYVYNESGVENVESGFKTVDSSHESIVDVPPTPSIGEFLGNRNLLHAGKDSEEIGVDKIVIDESVYVTTPSGSEEQFTSTENTIEENSSVNDIPPESNIEKIALPPETCDKNYDCSSDTKHQYYAEENAVTNARTMTDNSETLLYVCITAVTTLLFSLGYYFIESRRRDAFLIGKINNLEKDLMITKKECIMLDENFKSTKTKLDSIENESFGSNEMVLSLKAELSVSENTRVELEDQIASLEKELESTSEAGLELERMLREILSSQSEENNPLAQSIEDLQVRLNEQQIANESLENALAIKTQENETLQGDLTVTIKKVELLLAEVNKLAEELKTETSTKIHVEQKLTDQVEKLELKVKTISEDRSNLRKQLKLKELEVKELLSVVEQMNSNSLDFEKLYEVSQIKAEASHLREERDELKIKLSEEEGAHQLLEEHVKLVREEVAFLSEQCKAAEKEKKDAETRLEVLTRFFEEKEAQRQKEEAVWLEKQGEHSSTVERIQTMQNEILNYKQQIEMLKREILDQEREYKNQISALETKAHEHWVAARQNERRLEEVKAESSQLRNRLTLVEKNINEVDPEAKLHRLQHQTAIPPPLPPTTGSNQNGEAPGPLSLYPGGETSSSPLMFGPSGAPPLPPPSYLFNHPPLPSFLNSSSDQRPTPLGGAAGRLSSPPPTGTSGNQVISPPMSPPPHHPLHLPFPPPPPHHPHHHHHHMHLPPLPFASDVVPPPPLVHMPPPPPPLHHIHHQTHNTSGSSGPTSGSGWNQDDGTLPQTTGQQGQFRNSFRRESRNQKGSLHSSGESLDKSHHGGKV